MHARRRTFPLLCFSLSLSLHLCLFSDINAAFFYMRHLFSAYSAALLLILLVYGFVSSSRFAILVLLSIISAPFFYIRSM